jgi:PAS domain S-box-containing protein
MLMIDHAGTIVLVNAEIEQLFGYPREELVGEKVDMLVPARLRSHHIAHRDEFTRRPETRHMGAGRGLFGRRKDGAEFPVEVRLNPIHVGEKLLVLGVIVDISERNRTERLKDEFVSTVSHELRTPLTSITGSLGLLVGNAAGKLPASAARLLAIAHANSQRLGRLINDILDMEKIESGQVIFNLRRIEVQPLADQTIEANRAFAQGLGVRLRLDDALAAGGAVYADPDRLTQVVTNLLSNAIKFSPAGEEVVVAVAKRSTTIRISVRDHGQGIPPEFKPHIFEKFAQADATDARQKGGTGLGLSIVKQIVARLGGEVGFDDAAGGGTIFRVDLPAWEHVAGTEIDHQGPTGAARLLLCQDDPDLAIALRERLRQIGHSTDFAYTAADAAARTAATHYAVILVDLQRSDGDGTGLLLRLREQPKYHNTPFVVVGADPGPVGADLKSFALNAADWLAKPVDFDRLVHVLDRAVARHASERPQILHVDDDRDVLAVVAQALSAAGNVVSAASIDEAHLALADHHFDLAVLDMSLGEASGLDLLPELRDRAGDAIPVIIFSAHEANSACDAQVQVALNKSHASLDSLLSTVRDRLALRPSRAFQEVA